MNAVAGRDGNASDLEAGAEPDAEVIDGRDEAIESLVGTLTEQCAGAGACMDANDVDRSVFNRTELEELNVGCQNTMSCKCNHDAVAARNFLKLALASKVVMEDALSREVWEAR